MNIINYQQTITEVRKMSTKAKKCLTENMTNKIKSKQKSVWHKVYQ